MFHERQENPVGTLWFTRGLVLDGGDKRQDRMSAQPAIVRGVTSFYLFIFSSMGSVIRCTNLFALSILNILYDPTSVG